MPHHQTGGWKFPVCTHVTHSPAHIDLRLFRHNWRIGKLKLTRSDGSVVLITLGKSQLGVISTNQSPLLIFLSFPNVSPDSITATPVLLLGSRNC